MGRLKLDTQEAVTTYNQFDANACELGRKLLKQVKHREPGWQAAAAQAATAYQVQALRCPDSQGRELLLAAVGSKLQRIQDKVPESAQFSYALLKMRRELDASAISQDVVECMQSAPEDVRDTPEARNFVMLFSRLLRDVQSSHVTLSILQDMRNIGEPLRALCDQSKHDWLVGNLSVLQATIADKLRPYLAAYDVDSISKEAVRRVRHELDTDKSHHKIQSDLDDWLWGRTVTARSKKKPVDMFAMSDTAQSYFKTASQRMKNFEEAFEDLLDGPLSQEAFVGDFEVLTEAVEVCVERFAKASVVEDPQAKIRDAAWDKACERCNKRAEELGRKAADDSFNAQMRNPNKFDHMPQDRQRWEFHCQSRREGELLNAAVGRVIDSELATWKRTYPGHEPDDVKWVREHAERAASNALLMRRMDINKELHDKVAALRARKR